MLHNGFLELLSVRDIKLQVFCSLKLTKTLQLSPRQVNILQESKFPSILTHTEMIWHAVFWSKPFFPSCCDIRSCFVNLLAYTGKIRAEKKVKQQVPWLQHQSSGKASFQLKISVAFWTRRILCEESLKLLFSPFLLGVCCSVESFSYEIITMVVITSWPAETVRLMLKKSTFFLCSICCVTVLKFVPWRMCTGSPESPTCPDLYPKQGGQVEGGILPLCSAQVRPPLPAGLCPDLGFQH